MDKEFQAKIDEIGTTFERWAKEVADRIVEAAKQGAAAASQTRSAVQKSRQDAGETRKHSAEVDRESNGGANRGAPGDESGDDPWQEWARMRKDTWNRWASGKFDKATDGESMSAFYQEAVERWNESPFARMCDELFQQIEKVIRSAGQGGDSDRDADTVVREVIGEFVDAEVQSFGATSGPEEAAPSEYARSLIARVAELDRDLKPKKLAKALMAELEKDLAKMKKRKKKK